MIVPQHWAEARLRERISGRQVTVRRFGWSDASVADAERHAAERVAEAIGRVRAGESVPRRERKLVYGGAEGLPIREEVVGRHGSAVLTRNGYGAVCLNTPDVLFADIDLEQRLTLLWGQCGAVLLLLAALGACVAARWQTVAALVAAAVGILLVERLAFWWRRRKNKFERQARGRIARFAAAHPDWHLRVYRTPAGFRVLVLHRLFDPASDEVTACFRELGTDPVYAQMCRLQNCFRARVSPKPWRVGVTDHIRPHRGAWPVAAGWLPGRAAWVARYDDKARGFAACRFEFAVGGGGSVPAAEAVRRLHDELCRADGGLPLG